LILITETAAERVKSNLIKRGHGVGIRVGVRTTGCSGLAYTLEYVDQAPITRDQFVYEQHGVKIWVDGKSLVYVDGMEMDWVRNGLNEGFDFKNPKESARCGCGESFTV
jgi:iron-sulfur cluster assembly protein